MVGTIQVSSLEEKYGGLKNFIAPGSLKGDTLKLPGVSAVPLVHRPWKLSPQGNSVLVLAQDNCGRFGKAQSPLREVPYSSVIFDSLFFLYYPKPFSPTNLVDSTSGISRSISFPPSPPCPSSPGLMHWLSLWFNLCPCLSGDSFQRSSFTGVIRSFHVCLQAQ